MTTAFCSQYPFFHTWDLAASNKSLLAIHKWDLPPELAPAQHLLLRFLGLKTATTILGTGPTLIFYFDKQNTVNDSTSPMPDPYWGKILFFFPQTEVEGIFHFIGACLLSQGSLPVSQTWYLDKGSKVQSEFGTDPLDRAHAAKVVSRTISNTARM